MRHGAHIASIGGTWLALVYGFAGMRDHGGHIAFPPRLPAEWRRLRFALAIRGRRLRVEAGHEVTTYSLAESDELTIFHDGEPIRLTAATRTVSRAAPPSAWL